MQSLITLFTTLALLLHQLLGCCAHHAHAKATVTKGSHATTNCCKHHHRKHQPDPAKESEQENKSDDPSGGCDHGDCVYLALSSSPVTNPDYVDSNLFVNAIVVDFLTRPLAVLSEPPARAPLIRAHLLHQILLI